MRWLAVLAFAAPAAFAVGVQAGEPPAGERAFQKCYACHALNEPDAITEGPSLKDIVGRKVASQAGYRYSPALRDLAQRQQTWTREALDAFIANPQAVAPDNNMGFFGISDPEERRALVAFLATP